VVFHKPHFWFHSTMGLAVVAAVAACLLMMSASLILPVASPWAPDSILVTAGEGNPPIDLLPFLKQPDDRFSVLPGGRHRQLVFPKAVYPPIWDERKLILDEIKCAFADEGIVMVSCATDKADGKSEPNVARLECQYKSKHRPRKTTATEIQLKVHEDMMVGEEVQQINGLKTDSFINRQANCRPNENKVNKTRRNFKGVSHRWTEKLPDNCRCICHLRLQLAPGKHWFMTPNSGCGTHTCLFLPKEERIVRMATMTADEKRMAGSVASAGSISQAAIALKDMYDKNFTASQVRDLRQQHDDTMGRMLPMILEDGRAKDDLSDAERIIEQLKFDHAAGKKSFIALYHCVTAITLHTVHSTDLEREKKRHRDEASTTTGTDVDAAVSNECAITIDIECKNEHGMTNRSKANLNDEEKRQLAIVLKPIHERMQVGQKILLAVAWVREDEKRLFELYPEVFMIDVTFGSNCEGRPLGMTAAIDSNMHTFTPICAFLPSECRWVFWWMWEEAIPKLLGKDVLKRVQLVLSDGDTKIYVPFDDAKKKGLYPNAVHGLCLYHLVTQKLVKLPIHNREDPEVDAMVQT